MLREYLQAALRHAHYEVLTDDGSFYGEIPLLEGVLEEWVLFRVYKNLPLSVIDGRALEIREVA